MTTEEKTKNILTPKGELLHVTPGKLDNYGRHSCSIILSPEQAKPITDLIRNLAHGKFTSCKEKGEKIADSKYATPPFEQLEDGRFSFKFSENETGGPKDNPAKQFTHQIDYLDSKLNPWPESMLVGNGSIGRVAFDHWEWNVSTKGGIGVTLKLRAIQIINHIPYEPAQRTHGFDPEEGTTVEHHGFGNGESGEAGGPGDIPMAGPQDDAPSF